MQLSHAISKENLQKYKLEVMIKKSYFTLKNHPTKPNRD